MSITLTPSEATGLIQALSPKDQPLFIWGAPGIGKSSIVHQANGPVLDIRLSYYDPVDLHGLPIVKDGAVEFATPALLPRDGEGIIFLDELPNAARAVQSAALQLCLDRKLGEYQVPDGWQIIAAGNRLSDRAGVNPLISSLAARFTHIELEADINDWSVWALQNSIPTEVVAFIRFRRELLHDFDPAQKVSPNPRGWEFVSRLLGKGLPEKVQTAAITGTVGEGAAAEFAAFLRVWGSLPSVDEILLDPSRADVPTEPATLYALAGALANAANPDRLSGILTYLDRLPPEFSVFGTQAIFSKAKADGTDGALRKTSAFVNWAVSHQDVIL